MSKILNQYLGFDHHLLVHVSEGLYIKGSGRFTRLRKSLKTVSTGMLLRHWLRQRAGSCKRLESVKSSVKLNSYCMPDAAREINTVVRSIRELALFDID